MKPHHYFYNPSNYPGALRPVSSSIDHDNNYDRYGNRQSYTATSSQKPKATGSSSKNIQPHYHHSKAASMQFDPHFDPKTKHLQEEFMTSSVSLQAKLSPRIPGMQPQQALGDPSAANIVYKRKSMQNQELQSEAIDFRERPAPQPAHKKSKSSMQHKLAEFVTMPDSQSSMKNYERYEPSRPTYAPGSMKRLKQEPLRPTSATSGLGIIGVSSDRELVMTNQSKGYQNAYSGVFGSHGSSTYDYHINKSESTNNNSQKMFTFTSSAQTFEPVPVKEASSSHFKKQAKAKHNRTKSDQLAHKAIESTKYALKNNYLTYTADQQEVGIASKLSPEPQVPNKPHHVKSKSMINKNEDLGMYTRILKQFANRQEAEKKQAYPGGKYGEVGKIEAHPSQESYMRKEADFKKFPSSVETDLNAYIEKYKQRVAKAAAKAAVYKVPTTAHHIPTSVIASKKSYHKRSVSDGVVLSQAFQSVKKPKEQYEEAQLKTTQAKGKEQMMFHPGASTKPRHKKNTVSSFAGSMQNPPPHPYLKLSSPQRQKAFINTSQHYTETSANPPKYEHLTEVQSYFNTEASSGQNHSTWFYEENKTNPKYMRYYMDGAMAPKITEEDEIRAGDIQEMGGVLRGEEEIQGFYPRKGAIVLKSGGPVNYPRDSKSARVKEREEFNKKVGHQDFSFEKQLFARKNQDREMHSFPITSLQSFEKQQPVRDSTGRGTLEFNENMFAGHENMEKEFIIDDADFDTGHSYDDVETKPILTPHSGDDGVIDTQSSGIYREQHNNPPGSEQLSIKRKSSGEKYMSALKKQQQQQQQQKSYFDSVHKRYKSELNEVKKAPADQRFSMKSGQTSGVSEKGSSQLKQGYKKMHHYSQSITGAPGSFNPNLIRKPETSLGGGMASAISKYKKFMLTNSGDSSVKQSPRVVKTETSSTKHPSGKLNPYFPARSPDITTPPSDSSTPSISKPLQSKSSQIQKVERPIADSSKQKSGAFIYFKENQRKDTTPKGKEVSEKQQKTPLLYKRDKVKGDKAQEIRSKKQMEMFQQKTGEESPTSRPEKKQSSVNMDPLPSQMTLSEYPGVENMTPRTTARLKLIKLVRLSFATYNRPPKTTSDFYRVGKILGKGAFGKVNLAIHKLSQKMVALKSINKNYLSEEKQMKKKIMHEVNIIKVLRHKHIVKLFQNFETNKHIVFVMELCSGGDLLNYVRKRRRLKENYGKFVFKQILEALAYCHSKNILHRDIKLDNVLLDSRGNVKVCDFGVSKLVKKGERMTEQCGTPAYIAPEILQDQGYEGFAVDSWSAGVVLFAMLYGTVPFKANNMSDLHKLIIKAKYTLKDDISKEAQDLISKLLEPVPGKRFTIAEALRHPWFKDTPLCLEMFTEQETNFIKTEYTYNDARRLNRNNKQTSTSETDPFTEHNLDSINTGLDKNNTEKSVILAPFNSTRSDCRPFEIVKDKRLIKGKIKFAARCRELDRQYEANNNADLDNGVYNKLAQESRTAQGNEEEKTAQDLPAGKKRAKQDSNELKQEDSLVSSFNEGAKESQAELEQLESLALEKKGVIQTPEPLSFSDRKHYMNVEESLVIQEQYVRDVEAWGFPYEYIYDSLNNNQVNHATTSYYLLAWSANQPNFSEV